MYHLYEKIYLIQREILITKAQPGSASTQGIGEYGTGYDKSDNKIYIISGGLHGQHSKTGLDLKKFILDNMSPWPSKDALQNDLFIREVNEFYYFFINQFKNLLELFLEYEVIIPFSIIRNFTQRTDGNLEYVSQGNITQEYLAELNELNERYKNFVKSNYAADSRRYYYSEDDNIGNAGGRNINPHTNYHLLLVKKKQEDYLLFVDGYRKLEQQNQLIEELHRQINDLR